MARQRLGGYTATLINEFSFANYEVEAVPPNPPSPPFPKWGVGGISELKENLRAMPFAHPKRTKEVRT